MYGIVAAAFDTSVVAAPAAVSLSQDMILLFPKPLLPTLLFCYSVRELLTSPGSDITQTRQCRAVGQIKCMLCCRSCTSSAGKTNQRNSSSSSKQLSYLWTSQPLPALLSTTSHGWATQLRPCLTTPLEQCLPCSKARSLPCPQTLCTAWQQTPAALPLFSVSTA